MTHKQSLSWKIGGEAGFGIKASGTMLGKIFMRAGYEVFDYTEYPSLIRGGHNTFQVCVADQAINSIAHGLDILVALNQETIDKHLAELSPAGLLIFDQDQVKFKKAKINSLGIPLTELAKQAGGDIMRNVVAIGATLALVKQNLSLARQVVKQNFKSKGEKIVNNNLAALQLGYDHAKQNFSSEFVCQLPKKSAEDNMLISANEAAALGALAGGLNFYVAYPMTPSSSILHFLAAHAIKTGTVVKHAEDEIAVINMALGASLAGARAMVATSGGGFALMVESLGLTGLTETPLVIIDVQRPGPATGLPTWTEQGDLQFVLRAAQGDFPRIILAPGDTEEAFYLTAEAMNLAETYQVPVIILLDKFISEGSTTVPKFNTKHIKIQRGKLLTQNQLNKIKDYQRYQITKDGISPRALPGMPKGLYVANSDEHDTHGFSNEGADNRVEQVDKRQRKLDTFAEHMPLPKILGNPKAKKTVVIWGSTKGPIKDAYHSLPDSKQKQIKIMQLQYIWPFPAEFVRNILGSSKKVLLIENNSNAQLGQLIAQETGIKIDNQLLKYNGRPFFTEEILSALNDF
jgi:2-oxoglutarate/2-oxoacid ferredoxin oxidoreductase subunit alpha